jgi:hypothetical protein
MGLLLLSNNSYSSFKKFKIEDKTISIYYPKSWQFAYNFLSTPLTLFGPVKNNKRPVISVTNSTLKNFSFEKTKLSKNQQSYKDGRLRWLKKNKGKFVRFSGYRISKWNKIKEVHSIGYSYTIANELYLEKSYFFNCNEELYNITTLMTWEQNKEHGKQIKKMISSINCLKQ